MTCVWEADPACLGDRWEDLEPADQERSLMLATSSLQMLTLYRVGTCPITIRPCPETHACVCGGWNPQISEDGRWYNCLDCRRWCKPLSEIDLPGPVGYIDSLKVDGVEIDLDSGDFRLDNGHLLVWQGVGPSPIPTYQNLDLPDSAVGTWSVTYSRSYPVTAEAKIAVAHLAAEFAKACAPRGTCKLPRGVTNVVRNGVSFTIEAGLFPGGLTGLEMVDAFILKWAPAGAPNRNATVFTPGKPAPRRVNAVPRRAAP